jgi:lipopolysaccharide/colanic/teichoic acid biosynthesis glycosyltransferase
MKRVIDFVVSALALFFLSPLVVPILFLVWLQDYRSPFYIAPRVGKDEKLFKMIKIRSMIIDADKSGVDSTSSGDQRITKLGKFIRAYKLDELGQLANVFLGNMSLVGPRPNVERETRLYSELEKKLLTVKPGITDFASIVFSDEGDILYGHSDPDLTYNQLIRPGKSALGIFYIENARFIVDLKILILTILSFINRQEALNKLQTMLKNMKAPIHLIELSGRREPLIPSPPPGFSEIIRSRDL